MGQRSWPRKGNGTETISAEPGDRSADGVFRRLNALTRANRVLRNKVRELREAVLRLRRGEHRFRQIFDASPAVKLLIDPETEAIVDANPAAVRFYGYSRQQLTAMRIRDINQLSTSEVQTAMAATRKGDRHFHEFRHCLASGEIRDVEVFSGPVEMDGKVFLHSIVIDVTDRKRTERQLGLMAAAVENTHEGIVVTDADGIILQVNPAFERITGYPAAEVVGRTPALLKSGRHSGEFYRELWKTLRATGQWTGEIWNRKKSGDAYPERITISAIRDRAGAITHFVGVFQDITEVKRSEDALRSRAYHDPLTGLPNRSLLYDRLSKAIAHARRNEAKIAVLFLDLDRFKNVNDCLGHHVGDDLLQEVAERIKTCCREEDTVARLGGDEFTVILENVDENGETAVEVATRIISALSTPFRLLSYDVTTSTSIGIAIYPSDGRDEGTLMKNADMAMYGAKEAGRGRYRLFTPEMNEKAMRRIYLENQLRKAIDRNELRLLYQPKIDVKTGRITGTEALVRWQRDHDTLLTPDAFIPLAEESGIIHQLGEWILLTACRQTQMWQRDGYPDLTVAVNISGRQFWNDTLADVVRAVLTDTGLPAGSLILEVTENVVAQDVDAAIEIMGILNAIGVRLHIDDFGTGYSSLSYLKRFPLNVLKIDKSFVQFIPDQPDDVCVARAILSLAKHMILKVVAEGVETPEQMEFMRSHDCEEVQGYLFSHPLEPSEMTTLLRESTPVCPTASDRSAGDEASP
jgi:diguanylate cyclase (GGDEF)-like protein/PAS domain S-box-containing protein